MSAVRSEKETSRLGVYALLLFVVVAWGASFVAAQMILNAPEPGDPTLTPTMLAAVRFLIASAIFIPILFRQHRRARPVKVSDLPLLLLLGQLGISCYFWLQYTGVQLTNAGISAVLVVGTIPLATMVISGVALKEPLGGRRALALGVGSIGVAIVASQQRLDIALETGFLFGTLCLLANAVVFSLYSVLIRGIRTRYDPLTTTGAMMVAGTVGLLLLALATEDLSTIWTLTMEQWAAILYLSIICSVLGYFFYNAALSRIEAARAAVWIYLEPPVAVVLGAALLGESIAAQTVLGGILILGSLILTQKT